MEGGWLVHQEQAWQDHRARANARRWPSRSSSERLGQPHVRAQRQQVGGGRGGCNERGRGGPLPGRQSRRPPRREAPPWCPSRPGELPPRAPSRNRESPQLFPVAPLV
eukprot:scaffold26869_cov63-Phaeocystis_antarctica.AAC.1